MKTYNKSRVMTLAIIAMVISVALITSPLKVFAQTPESISLNSDKRTYEYGQPINLTIEDFNNQSTTTISTFEANPASGFKDPCGKPYLSFDFLQGNYSNIHTYSQVVSLNGKSLNVMVPVPDQFVNCPFTIKNFQRVVIDGQTHNATMTIEDNHGKTIVHKIQLKAKIPLSYEYSSQIFAKNISPNSTYYYRTQELIPVGTYTIIGFAQSGQISRPVVIQISNNTISSNANSNVIGSITKTTSQGHFETSLMEMFIVPGLFGTLMAANYRKTGKVSKSFVGSFVTAIIVSGMLMATPGLAYATYSTSSQGDEIHGTGSGFNQATLEDEVNGFQVTQYGGSYPSGFSTQNNQFVEGFKVGTNFLWSQSFVQADYSTTSYNSHSCTDADANSVNCYLPTTVNLTGAYNFWTDPSSGTTCPTGFTYDSTSGQCYKVGYGTTTGVSLSSSDVRLDLNAYQEIQSTGDIYLDAKYRLCTTSCPSSYTTLNSYTATGYAQAPQNGYYGDYYDGTTFWYGIGATVGECSACDDGFGTVQFKDGTYLTHVYTINNSGTGQYRSSGTTEYPLEENSQLCWHDTISSSGSTTLTTSSKYGSSCAS